MSRLVLVNGDEWEGLYLDGVLQWQNHSVNHHHVAQAINASPTPVTEMVHVEVDVEWMLDEGYLPRMLEDIPLDKIVSGHTEGHRRG